MEDKDLFYCKTGKISSIFVNRDTCDDEVELVLGKDFEVVNEGGKTILRRSKVKLDLAKYPKTWKDCEGYVSTSTVKNVTVPTENKEAWLALGILLEIRNTWWKIYGDWNPKGNENSYVYSIIPGFDPITNRYVIIKSSGVAKYVNRILVFPTSEIRDEFLNCFGKDLINAAMPLL